MNSNTQNQNEEELFTLIDVTCQITKEDYPFVIYGRSYPNRKTNPINVGDTSSEEMYQYVINLSLFW